MQTIAIVNEKGGTAKTTTSVNLSAALGVLGKRVLLVDLDGQAASSRWLGVEEDTRLAEALVRGKGLQPVEDVIPGVSLAPGSGKLDSVAHDLRPTQGGQLRKLLSQVKGYDYTVIDCPPSLGNRLIGNALLAATHAIVPVETSVLALDGLKILLTTIQDVRDGFGHEIILAGVLACRYDARTKLSRFILAELKRALPGKVFKTVIRENVRMRECPASGQSILTYAPDSHAAEDYMSLAHELLALPIQGFQPTIDGVHGAEGDLTEEEKQAVVELREQVDAMVQTLGTKAREHPSPAGKTAGTSDREDAGELEDELAPAEVEEDEETSRQEDRPDEVKEPVVGETEGQAALAESLESSGVNASAQQAQQAGTEPQPAPASLQDDEGWEFLSEKPQAQPREVDGWEIGSAETETPIEKAEESRATGPAILGSASDELTEGETAAVEAQESAKQPWQTSASGGEDPSPAEADEELAPAESGYSADVDLIEETASVEEEHPAGKTAAKDRDYPALRAMLQKLVNPDGETDAQDSDAGGPAEENGGDTAWRRIFRKRPA